MITKHSTQVDLAYRANQWGSLLSVVFYMISNVIFLDVIFRNVSSVAGYSRDEVLFFNLVSQAWFFIIYLIFAKNLEILARSINNGEFDLILTKPLPSLFFTLFRTFHIYRAIKEAIPSMLILIIVINWNNINIIPINFILGIIVTFIGLISSLLINFIATLPVFWLGNNDSIGDLSFTIEDNAGHSNFVYEAWNNFWKIVFTIIFPVCLSTALSTSIFLGKTPALEMTIVSILVTIVFIFISLYLWKTALRNYTSASS